MFLSSRRRAHHRNQVAAFLTRRREITAAAADVAAQKLVVNGAREDLVAMKANANAARADYYAAVDARGGWDSLRKAFSLPLVLLVITQIPLIAAAAFGAWQFAAAAYWPVTGPALTLLAGITIWRVSFAIRAIIRHYGRIREEQERMLLEERNVQSATVQVRLEEAILDAASRRLAEAKRR